MIKFTFICRKTFYNVVLSWPSKKLLDFFSNEDLDSDDPVFEDAEEYVEYYNDPHRLSFWVKSITPKAAKRAAYKYFDIIKGNPTKCDKLFKGDGSTFGFTTAMYIKDLLRYYE